MFGSKIAGSCIFLGLHYEAPSELPPPRHEYCEYPLVSTTTKRALFKVRVTIGMECVHVPNACQMKQTLYAIQSLML